MLFPCKERGSETVKCFFVFTSPCHGNLIALIQQKVKLHIKRNFHRDSHSTVQLCPGVFHLITHSALVTLPVLLMIIMITLTSVLWLIPLLLVSQISLLLFLSSKLFCSYTCTSGLVLLSHPALQVLVLHQHDNTALSSASCVGVFNHIKSVSHEDLIWIKSKPDNIRSMYTFNNIILSEEEVIPHCCGA